MTRLFCSFALLLLPLMAASWKPLFNGRNLDGWEVRGDGVWTVADGVLIGQRDPSLKDAQWPLERKQYNAWLHTQAWLYTKQEYTTFDLHVEYWVRAGGNSGISIRDTSRGAYAIVTPADSSRTPAKLAYEIQINNGYPDPTPTGSIYNLAKAEVGSQKDNQWNALDIESRPDRIRVRLNGKLVAEHPGVPDRPKSGPIGLQLHDQYSVAMFRNIRIREIAEPAGAERHITHGPATGDVSSDSAVIWARADGPGTLRVAIDGIAPLTAPLAASSDFTGKVQVTGLKPATVYHYQVSAAGGPYETGTFRTAPAASSGVPVKIAWGGDIAGQNVCRDAQEGFPIFKALRAVPLDLFIGLGDIIYADNTCEAKGRYGNTQIPGGFVPSADMANYWAHWKYSFADPGFRSVLKQTPFLSIWDDHEVVNDFGPKHDTRTEAPYQPDVHLMPMGLEAYRQYNAIAGTAGDPSRLYRKFRWGRHLEIFVLDTRQYRDSNAAPDSPTKTLLGREQMEWLRSSLASSDATWKLIVSSVPMSIPTGSQPGQGRDGWARYEGETGARTELTAILALLRQHARNTVWITTDVHFATAFRYTPFPDDPKFQVHEFITGPMNAGLFPTDRFDPAFSAERLFFYGPKGGDSGLQWTEAKKFMNFGMLEIDSDGVLKAAIRDVSGEVLYTLSLKPQA